MEAWLDDLEKLVVREDEEAIVSHLKRLVPEYQPMGRWREALELRNGTDSQSTAAL